MHQALSLSSPTKATSVKAEIEASTILSVKVTCWDELLIIRYVAEPVGKYLDIVFGDNMSWDEQEQLVELCRELGCGLETLEVEREEFSYPHPDFLTSKSFMFIRICPKVAL
ncbi:hypothetical protein [Streptomyces sp. H39-S7]|uniref:hypothetical protein n=1 Tax=Streptomyces sp. H39-S7 TaxID=3004357 RepID=UPI0022AF3B9C|nr:hypothetical protein [Streptomyces sp. H39-S7]MCZ4119025.1 hypothetical protein [Streptomyces sp. H39-S7]